MQTQLLKIKNFRFIMGSRICLYMALQIQAVIVGWQIYTLKKDPILLGLMGLVEAVPAILGAFVAGHVVDNNQPSRIIFLSILVILINSLILFAAMAFAQSLGLSENLLIFVLYFAIFISGAARSFTSPAIYSLIPNLIPRNLMASASAFSSSSYQLAAILGPAVGGLVYGLFGNKVAFVFPLAFSTVSLILVGFFDATARSYRSHTLREPFWKSITSGISFSLKHRVLFPAMTLDMFSVLFGGAVAVLPIFADEVFHVGPSGLGFLRAAPSVGSVIVSVWLAFKPMKRMDGKKLIAVVVGWALSTIFFALTENFYLALIFLAMSGAFDGISMVIRGTILQIFTPDEMRGRVSAVNSVFVTSSNEIGAFESGFAASIMGLVPSVVLGGLISLVVVTAIHLFYPDFSSTKVDTLADS